MHTQNYGSTRDTFVLKASATAVANQAILKCTLSGFPLTPENVILFVGDFFDPTAPGMQELAEMISHAIDEVIECRERVQHTASRMDI